jgi:hypothetical protein
MQLLSQKANVVRINHARMHSCEDCKFQFIGNLSKDQDSEGEGGEATGKIRMMAVNRLGISARDRTLLLWNMVPLFIVI